MFSHRYPTKFEVVIIEVKRWKAISKKITAINKNTWELTDLVKGHKTISVK